jgi:hypothetical protein
MRRVCQLPAKKSLRLHVRIIANCARWVNYPHSQPLPLMLARTAHLEVRRMNKGLQAPLDG